MALAKLVPATIRWRNSPPAPVVVLCAIRLPHIKLMKQAYEARPIGSLSLKHFTTLNTAAQLQRLRLKSAPMSRTAADLLKEIETASDGKLRFLRWAMYGNNQPQHPVHKLSAQEVERIWEAIKSKPASPCAMAA